MSDTDDIRIADAYENNLKHVSLTIPKGKLVVFAVAVAGATMALMPGEALAFLGLFESEPTKAEMEKMDALFNGYYKAPEVEDAIAILPSVKKMNKLKPGGIPSMIGFYFGAAKSSTEAWRAQWSSVSLAKNHPTVAAELEVFALNADKKSVRNFFNPELNDAERTVLSPAAVARIVSCGVAERKAPAENKLREALLKANEVTPSTKTGEPR